MGDTIQLVQWSLRQSCKLRDGSAVDDPAQALNAVRQAQIYSEYLQRPDRGFGIFGDVCVTSFDAAEKPARLKKYRARYPETGFVISKEFRGVGGADGLAIMCGGCPANTSRPAPAGCAGYIWRHPKSAETQEELEGIISRLGLAKDLESAFPHTMPIWHGLWARSPLSAQAIRLLRKLIAAMGENAANATREQRWMHGKDDPVRLAGFGRALELAETGGLRLDVSMAPPGHSDLGWDTTFPHCPFCKAEANLPRWQQRKYSWELYTCRVCGTRYPPAKTASKRRWRDFGLGPTVRDALGDSEFAVFAKSYLVTLGIKPDDADEVVALSEAREAKRREEQKERQELNVLRRRFIETVLFAGLHPVRIPDYDPADTAADDEWNFNALEFAELLHRCRERGVGVTFMYHLSQSGELDRRQFSNYENPAGILSKWVSEGCQEAFGAHLSVPDHLLREPAKIEDAPK